MPLRVPDEEEQSHSVIQKQAPRRYPTQGPKHRHLQEAQLPWVISPHPCGLAGCHRPLTLLHPSHKPGPEYFPAMGSFAFCHPGTITEARELLQQCHVQHPSPSPAVPWPPPTLQSHHSSVPTLHPHAPSLPALVQTFPLPPPAPPCEGKPVLARQGKKPFS